MRSKSMSRFLGITVISFLGVFFSLQLPAQAASKSKIRLSPDIVKLNKKEIRALNLTGNWIKSGAEPFLLEGKLTYVHGSGGYPTIISAPMQVSDVELQPGESINEIVVGDSARWIVAQGMSGNTEHIFIKPVDSGLQTSAVITTDRRVYHLRLISRQKDHMPYVGFVYTTDLREQLATEDAEQRREKQWQTTTIADGSQVDISSLNFNYTITGDARWKPERVYDDGTKTYIQLPTTVSGGNEIPVLLVQKGDRDVLVNYHVKGQNGRAIQVDGLFEKIALVIGVGKSREVVEITRNKINKTSRVVKMEKEGQK